MAKRIVEHFVNNVPVCGYGDILKNLQTGIFHSRTFHGDHICQGQKKPPSKDHLIHALYSIISDY